MSISFENVDYDLNSLFNLQYSFDSLKSLIKSLSESQKISQDKVRDLERRIGERDTIIKEMNKEILNMSKNFEKRVNVIEVSVKKVKDQADGLQNDQANLINNVSTLAEKTNNLNAINFKKISTNNVASQGGLDGTGSNFNKTGDNVNPVSKVSKVGLIFDKSETDKVIIEKNEKVSEKKITEQYDEKKIPEQVVEKTEQNFEKKLIEQGADKKLTEQEDEKKLPKQDSEKRLTKHESEKRLTEQEIEKKEDAPFSLEYKFTMDKFEFDFENDTPKVEGRSDTVTSKDKRGDDIKYLLSLIGGDGEEGFKKIIVTILLT
jgi:hypothetical protein